jgi:hypothetical protein
MNDDFIYRALPEVPKEFAESLYANISTNMPSRSKRGVYAGLKGLRRTQVVLIALGVLLLVAWSQIRLWIRYVPVGELWLVELSRSTVSTTGQQPLVGPIPTPRQYPTVIVEGTVFYLWKVNYLSPDWIPTGFQEMPPETNSYGTVITIWSNDAKETIRFFGVPQAGGMHPYAPADMYEEVSIHGEPAILIHGKPALTSAKNPTAPRKWDEKLGLQLSCVIDEAVYTLETFGPYVSERDLIRMAESMKILPWPESP